MSTNNQFPEYDKYLDGDEEVIVKRSKLNRNIEPKQPVENIQEFEDISSNYEPSKRPEAISFAKKLETQKKEPEKQPMEDISSKSNNSSKKLKIGLGILCGVTGVLEVIAIVMLAMIGVLPIGIIALISVAFALLLFVICTLMFMKSKHKFGKRKIAATILAVITIISCVIGIFFMSKILGVFGTITKDGKKISKDQLDDPFIVYLSGSDTRNDKLSEKTRSDVNILAVVNPVTRQVLLLNTPRDYYVENPNCANGMDKLTHCGLGGVQSSMKALEQLYDIDGIDYYARINFSGFETLIDTIGGIEIYSDSSFVTTSTEEYGSVSIKAGDNHLSGIKALAFARERHALAGGDLARGENQMKVIKAIVNKLTSSDTLIKNYSSIMNSMSGMFETDTPKLLIQDIIKNQLSDSGSWNIETFAVTGTVGTAVCASSGESLSVVYQDKDSISQAKELIKLVFDGEKVQ